MKVILPSYPSMKKELKTLAGHDVQYGKHRTRRSFFKNQKVLDLPNLIEIQTDSFKDFLDHGLKEVFEDVLPISNFTDTMELEFVVMKSANLSIRLKKRASTMPATQHQSL